MVDANSGILPYSPFDKDCGGITTAGSVVLRSGSILWGSGINGLNITGGQVINYGVMMGENFRIAQQRTVENKGSGKIYAGYSIGKGDDNSAFNSVYTLLLGTGWDVFWKYDGLSFHDQAYERDGASFDFSKLTTDDMGQYLSGQNVTFASGAVTGAGSVAYYTPDDPYAKDPWVMIYGYSSIRSAWETAYYGAKSNLQFEYYNIVSDFNICAYYISHISRLPRPRGTGRGRLRGMMRSGLRVRPFSDSARQDFWRSPGGKDAVKTCAGIYSALP